MNLTGKYIRAVTNDEGETEITFSLSGYQSKAVAKELEKGIPYRIKAEVIKSKRSIEQNKLLWAIIHEIAEAREYQGDEDWDIYCEALERAGAKYEYLACLPEAEGILKEQFRAVKLMNQFQNHGRTFNQYKVFYGSSKMNTKEMSVLLETVRDMAALEGIYEI